MANPLQANEIPKKIEVTLHDGSKLEGEIFCDTSPQSIQKVLNDRRKFLPVRVGDEMKFISKTYIVLITPK